MPVLLTADRINTPDPERIVQRARLAYGDQYENLPAETIRNIPVDRMILIVDDYDKANINARHIGKVTEALKSSFHSILLSTAQLFALNLLSVSNENTVVAALQRVEIREIGHKRRYDLIERWCLAGQQEEHSDEILRNQIELKRAVVNQIFNTNLVPRTPIIVLILLQAMEAGQAGDLARTGYVRYYKFLIDSAILRHMSREAAEMSYALLPEIAWAMYISQSGVLQPDGAEGVIEGLAKRRALRKTSLYNVLASLRQVGMFEEHGSNLRFKHKYAYYFFLADYISRHLGESTMKEEVKRLCNGVTSKSNSDILIFLSFHSDDQLIVNTLVEGLSSTFLKDKPFAFAKDRTAPVNHLIYDMPKLIVDQKKFERNRKRRLEAEDTAESNNFEEEKEEEHKSDAKVSDLRVVFTSVEILGHVLRNHYARLDAEPKKLIFDTARSATLRCLGSVFDQLSSSLEDLVATISVFTDRLQENATETRQRTTARRTVFYVVTALFFFIIQKLSRSVGDESLEITFNQAITDAPDLANAYIDLMIKLNCFRDFPLNELRRVVSELEGDRVGTIALQLAVCERLDMRPPGNASDLQRICDAVGLDLRARLIARGR